MEAQDIEGKRLFLAAAAVALAIHAGLLLALANPIAIAATGLGAVPLWRRQRPLAVVSLVLVLLYLNNLWLAPFDVRTAMGLHRGLSVLMLPVAIAAGCAVAGRPRARAALVGASALLAVGTAFVAVPDACHVRRISVEETYGMTVWYCEFAWRRSPRVERRAPGARDAARVPMRAPPGRQ